MSAIANLKESELPEQTEVVLREALVAEAMKPIAAELRLCDLSALARHILSNEAANLQDLLESSSELYFKPRALAYAGSSSIDLNWNGDVTVCLQMKFSSGGVNVMFHLFFLALNSAVDVKFISFEHPSQDQQENTKQLDTALFGARVNL